MIPSAPTKAVDAGNDIRRDVVKAIRQASQRTGVDFSYLLANASAESSLNPGARAGTSSARGLYQFTQQTWLETVSRYGARHGLGREAAAISHDAHGRAMVTDGAARERILALRDDPDAASLMAAELAQDNRGVLERKLGREVSNAEVYMAHFLGAGAAAKFIASAERTPDIDADNVVPRAARANAGVFYRHGKALSANDLYQDLAARFDTPERGRVAPAVGVRPGLAASKPELAALMQSLQAGTAEASTVERLPAAGTSTVMALNMLQTLRLGAREDKSRNWRA